MGSVEDKHVIEIAETKQTRWRKEIHQRCYTLKDGPLEIWRNLSVIYTTGSFAGQPDSSGPGTRERVPIVNTNWTADCRVECTVDVLLWV